MNNNNKVDTWLPLFSGFYGGYYEPNEEYELEHINDVRVTNDLDPILDIELLEFDYDEYYKNLSKDITEVIGFQLLELNLIKSIEYQNLVRPREYNFSNDSIEVSIEPNKNEIESYWRVNRIAFESYLKNNYTSYDGFISSHPNSNWNIDDILQGPHKLGAFLNFALKNENIKEYDLLDDLEELGCISASNYDDAIKMDVEPQIPNVLQGRLKIGCLEQINALKDYESRLKKWGG